MAIAKAEIWWQVVTLPVFLVAKLSFERYGAYLARWLGADVAPFFVFVSAYCYEYNLCVILAGGFHVAVFLELLSFDTIENMFHLYSLHRSHAEQTEGPHHGDVDTSRRQQYIMAALLIREMVEIIIPVSFLGQFVALRWLQPRYNNMVCSLTDDESNTVVMYLVCDVCVEVVVAIFTFAVLRRLGFAPFEFLRALVAKSFLPFMLASSSIQFFYLALQHSHCGADLTFNFMWLKDESARWECGLSWSKQV